MKGSAVLTFYDSLQLDPAGLKAAIRTAPTGRQRNRLRLAMLVRAILIVGFSIVLIAPISSLFGAENSCVGVVLLCILLSIRFVDFGYCIRDSLINLGLSFFILWTAPALAALTHPVLGAVIHFAALFALFVMTSQRPEMGNGGLYAFSYIFLTGNPVSGELLWNRGLLLLLGFVLCGSVFLWKHRRKHEGQTFIGLLRQFRLSSPVCRWQLQFALGVSLLLAIGSCFRVERLMWAGFACASLLGCYSSTTDGSRQTRERFSQRIVGAITGSVLFAAVYAVLPASLHGLFGPLGGVCLGFCTDYRYKTALNCFGALLLATGLYGLQGSVLLRIINNLLGAAFGFGFILLYRKVMDRRFAA